MALRGKADFLRPKGSKFNQVDYLRSKRSLKFRLGILQLWNDRLGMFSQECPLSKFSSRVKHFRPFC